MISKYRLLISNMIIFAIGNIAVKLISFFLMPIYTSVLTTSQYGMAELLNNAVEIVLPITTLCVIDALYRFSIDTDIDYSSIFSISCLTVIIGDICVGIGCFIIYKLFNYEYLNYFFLLFISTTLYKLTTQFARGMGHIRRYSAYGIINALILISSNYILLVIFKTGVCGYLFSFSLGYGITGIVAFFVSKQYKYIKLHGINKDYINQMLSYSIPNIPTMLSWWVYNLSDRYVVLIFWGTGIAGLYTAGSKIPAMINLIATIFQMAWQYSTAVEIEDQRSKEFFSNVFRIFSYFCILVCSMLMLANKLICHLLLQADFYVAWRFIPILLVSATFGAIGIFFGTFYNALKSNKMLMFSTVVGGLINIILNFILIPYIGVYGAAIATAISYCFVMIIRIWDIRNKVEMTMNSKKFICQCILLTIIVACACFDNIILQFVSFGASVGIIISDIEVVKIAMKYLLNMLLTEKSHN